ncbi:MAG: metallophosphoesterase [Promethearchaeota archaeon]
MTIVNNHPDKYMEHLLKVLLGSRINIEPKALWYLGELHVEDRELEKFLQKISFSSSFNSYISWDLVHEEFSERNKSRSKPTAPSITKLESLPDTDNIATSSKTNTNIKSDIESESMEVDQGIPTDFSEYANLTDSAFSDMESQDSSPKKPKQTILAPNPKVPVSENPILNPTKDPSYIFDMDFRANIEGSIEEENLDINIEEQGGDLKDNLEEKSETTSEDHPVEDSQKPIIQKSDLDSKSNTKPDLTDDITEQTVSSSTSTAIDTKLNKIRESKRKSWETLSRASGTSTFKPIAAEYAPEIKILQDPTGKLYTDGKLKEFISVQQDKFAKLSDILNHRPEASGLLDINMINRLENSTEIRFIGMVVEKRQTKSRNYLIIFEDTTGQCTTLVRQKTKEVHQAVDHLLPDHVVIVDGFLSVNPDTHSRIILVNDLIFPDSPTTHKIKCPKEDLAICFISDTHFGSSGWLDKIWHRFVDYLNCRIGNDRQREQAGKIKYLCIAGDLVDGIGVYPNQDKHLTITDIYKQYEASAEYLAAIPDYIKIIISPGDHDAVRKAIPNPAIPKDIAPDLYDQGYLMMGNPTTLSFHGIKTQMFHGTSLIDINMSIPGMSNEDPFGTMKELLRCRDLAPTYGKKTEIAPVEKNWMVMDSLPDILHTGHLHKNGYGKYHGILAINSGCFQAQTDFMDSLGIVPDYGKPTIVNIKDRLKTKVIDLVGEY